MKQLGVRIISLCGCVEWLPRFSDWFFMGRRLLAARRIATEKESHDQNAERDS